MLKIPVGAIGQIDEGIVCVSDYQLHSIKLGKYPINLNDAN